MNKVILMGRLTRDPEITRTERGSETLVIARYSLAVDRRGQKDKDGNSIADFPRCVAFGGRAEFAEKYFKQGMRVLVSGSIQTGSYTNKDGQKVYTTDVIIDEQEFADSKNSSNSSGNPNSSFGSYVQQGTDIGDGFMNIPDGVEDEGLPFN